MQKMILDGLRSGLSLEASFAALDQMPFAVCIKDQDLRYRVINKQFSGMLPRKAEDLIGLTVRDLYPDDVAKYETREREVLETGVDKFYQETRRNALGVEREYFNKITRFDGGAEGMFICITLTDVTDLNAARLQALEADKLKSEFLANMSHEIRTPLNGVLGMTELLRQSDLTDQQHSLAQIVSNSGVQLLRIIDDIMDFSHLETGQMALKPSTFDLEMAVDDVVTLLTAQAAEKNITLITHIRPTAPTHLKLDEARVRQVLINLLGNAIKFTDAGHILIDVGMSEGHLRVAGQDTGLGIPEEDRKRIFKKFVRSDLQGGKLRGGAGLGLTISASLVELMNGEIGVESKTGQGSRFWFKLPIEPAGQTEEVVLDPGIEVTIIDQDQVRAEATADRLKRWGCLPKQLAPDTADPDTQVVLAGPDIEEGTALSAGPNADIIVLAPMLDIVRCGQESGRLHHAAYPLRGVELKRMLAEITEAKAVTSHSC